MSSDPGMSRQPQIILITGNMASGKSTIAQAVAERFPRSVHLRGDLFRRLIVRGQAAMDADLSPEAYAQLQLRYALAASVARQYVAAGFTVVYQDIIIGPAFTEVVRGFDGVPLTVIVLCPAVEVIAAREQGREKSGYRDEAAMRTFDRVLKAETPRLGYWLDTSALTVAASVEAILAQSLHAALGAAPED